MSAPGAHLPYGYLPPQMAPQPNGFAPVHHHQPYAYAYGQHPAMAMHQPPPAVSMMPNSNMNQSATSGGSTRTGAAASTATLSKKGGSKAAGAKPTKTAGGSESDEDGDGHEGECSHNHWDNIRVKKGIVTLACRFCKARWKLAHPIESKCPSFYAGFCPFGPHCPLVHVHRFKSKIKSPDPPNYFEGGIAKDCDFSAVVRSILEKHQGGEAVKSPADVYEEVIVAYALRQQQEGGGASPNAVLSEEETSPKRSEGEAGPNGHASAAHNAGAADYEVTQTWPETVVASSVAPVPDVVQVAPPAAPQQPPPADVDPFADDFGLQPLKIPKKDEEPNKTTIAGSRIAVSPAVASGLKTPGSVGIQQKVAGANMAVAPGTPITRRFVSSMREIDAENKKRSSVPSTPNLPSGTPHTPGTGLPIANRPPPSNGSLKAVPLTPGLPAPDFSIAVMSGMSGIPPSPWGGGQSHAFKSQEMAEMWNNENSGSYLPQTPGPIPQQQQQQQQHYGNQQRQQQ